MDGLAFYNVAYGTQDNPGAILASGDDGLWISTAATPAAGTLNQVAAYAGLMPTGLAFDLRRQSRFFVADSTNLYGTTNTGASFQTLTANLNAASIIRPDSVEFIANNGVDALLVGGVNSVANARSPIAVADSDSSGNLSGWRSFGTGLPNTIVDTMNYDPKSDTLAVGLFGRGGWVLYDVTSNFSSATVLQFGLANNNSAPDASLLTGSRPLMKYGTGTLTITGSATYSGGSTIEAGVMQIGNGGTTGSIIGAVEDEGTLVFDRSDNLTFEGAISGLGSLVQMGGGALALTGANSYSGSTTVEGGTLSIGAADNIGTGALTLQSGSTLDLSAAFELTNDISISGAVTIDVTTDWDSLYSIAGAGSLTVKGGGGLALENDDTYTGNTTVNGGEFDILTGGALGKGTLTLNNVADFYLNGGFALGNDISIAGGLRTYSFTPAIPSRSAE